MRSPFSISFICFKLFSLCVASDITTQVFGNVKDGIIAAFGDFNSDELTDIFLLRNNFHTLQILLGSDTEPLLTKGPSCEFPNYEITSVIPGDFDGDALMDVLVTLKRGRTKNLDIKINWGGSTELNCSSENEAPLIQTYGEPLAIDYNRDMIIDLFGYDHNKDRQFWIFKKERGKFDQKQQPPPKLANDSDHDRNIKIPHAHAYLDLNNDFTADLFIQTKKHFEVWYGRTGDEKEDFDYSHKIDIAIGNNDLIVGQTIFLDMELKGVQNQILPVCFDRKCEDSAITVLAEHHYHNIQVNFKDPQGVIWGFLPPSEEEVYTQTITARGGDFNMDGYPDLLVTLKAISKVDKIQIFLLENVPCTDFCRKPLVRTFEVKWNALSPMGSNIVAGAFYDFYQDGVLDVVLVEKKGNNYRPLAFRNTLDYDANFVKVIVLTGLVNKKNSTEITPLGRKKRTYGTNLPGPHIAYYTTTQEGDNQHGSSAQLPQSSYFALQLPYTIFGLGRTPNFVDSLTVGMGNKSRTWTQLIPNSQMIVVPNPIDDPSRWKAQLFVTPSKLILMSVIALGGTCLFIMIIILGLYIKEKREDKQEKLQEAHRFHFDAM